MKSLAQSLKPSEDKPSEATNGRAAHDGDSPLLLEGPSGRLAAVSARISAACQVAQRDRQTVQLIAVSKTKPAQMVMELAACGQTDFGENYLQEGMEKITACKATMPTYPFVWHFIGPIQSNKTRPIAESFDWVHSVERLKIAQRLSEQRPPALPVLNICIQVNVSGEASKSGCMPEQALDLVQACLGLKGIQVRGLMAIPEPGQGADESFKAMRVLLKEINQSLLPVAQLDTLSMGMSDDLEAAIGQGSTLVRVGTALFGARV